MAKSNTVVLGLSGGRDSVYLLHWLLDNGYEVVAVHVNHQIRHEANSDEEFCRALCSDLNVEFYAETVDVPSLVNDGQGSLETVAACKRREILLDYSSKKGNCPIALAHHKTDNVETVLFQLCRGSGGVVGMKDESKYGTCTILRPLLHMSREQITRQCKKNGWEWVEDKTNAISDTSRNIIRNEVLPTLKRALGHPVVENFNRSIEIQQANNAALYELIETLPVLDPQGRLYLPFLQDKSDELCGAIIYWFLKKNKFPHVTHEKVKELVDICKYRTDEHHTRVYFTMWYRAVRRHQRLTLYTNDRTL